MDSIFHTKKLYTSFFPILAVLFFIAYWYFIIFSPSHATSSLETLTPNLPLFDYEVLYTENGYIPNTLDVPIGSRVAFTNTMDIPMWTASDPHPIHSDFSTFDAKRGYLNGETYIFHFKTQGTFSFHNHEKSIHRGIIRVFDPLNSLPEINKTKESQRATRDKFLSLLDKDNPDSVFTVIDAIESDNKISRDCHDIAHDIGHRAYELFGFSTAMTFDNPAHLSHTSVDDLCAGGYMHGILEELFLHQPELKQQPGNICSSIPDINRDSCFHGVGHGLMFVNERNVTTSLGACRKIDAPIYVVSRCFEGVFMEMFWGNTDHAGANSLGWTPEKPLVPCTLVSGDEKPACFLYAHLGYLRTHSRNFAGAINLCTQSSLNKSDTWFCLKGVGITMMKHFTSHRLEQTEALVAHLIPEEKRAYYEGIIGYARLSNVSDAELSRFCSTLKKDTSLCQSVIESIPR